MDDRRSTMSIWLMASDAIRKAVMFHHTQLRPSEIEMMENMKGAICETIRDYPGGTLAIKTTIKHDEPSSTLQTVVAYKPPAARGTRRARKEQRRMELRDDRRRAALARGAPAHSLTFFGYETDVSDDEPSEAEDAVAVPLAAGTRRTKRARRSLIRRLTYYPPRAPTTRQRVLDFVRLRKDGDEFAAPVDWEEEVDEAASECMESDFDDEERRDDPPARPANLPALCGAVGAERGDAFSPTSSARALVQSLRVASPQPPNQAAPAPLDGSVWGLGLFSSVPAQPSRGEAATALWRANESLWDAMDDEPPYRFPPLSAPPALNQDEDLLEEEDFVDDAPLPFPEPSDSDAERLGEGAMMERIYGPRRTSLLPQQQPEEGRGLAAALAEALPRAASPAPAWPAHELSPHALQLLYEMCTTVLTQNLFQPDIVYSYMCDVARGVGGAAASTLEALRADESAAYARFDASDRFQYRIFAAMVWEAYHGWPAEAAPPAAAAATSAPATSLPSSSSSTVDSFSIPGVGAQHVESGGDLPASFTNRARMKRQREQRAATAANIAAAHAKAAELAAREAAAAAAAEQQQQAADPALVAGTSGASFDHERRKARRVSQEPRVPRSASADTTGAAAEAVAAAAAAANAAAISQQRVLGAVPQQSSSSTTTASAAAAAAAANGLAAAIAASSHSALCPCEFCPSGRAAALRTQRQIEELQARMLPSEPVPMANGGNLHTFDVGEAMRNHLQLQILQAQQAQQQLQQAQQLRHAQMMQQLAQQAAAVHQQQQAAAAAAAHHAAAARAVSPIPGSGRLQRVMPQQQFSRAPGPPGAPMLETSRFSLSNFFMPSREFYGPPSYSTPPVALPPSFVDLPPETTHVARQHMFTPQPGVASSLASAAALATQQLAAATQLGSAPQLLDSSVQRSTDQLLASLMHFQEMPAAGNLHMFNIMSTAGLPPQGEAAPIGAHQRDIEKYTTIQEWTTTTDTDVDPCTVCMSEFEGGEQVRSLPCAHAFHVRCIDRWLTYNKKCPNCRVDLDFADAALLPQPAAAPARSAAVRLVQELARARNFSAAAEQAAQAVVAGGDAAALLATPPPAPAVFEVFPAPPDM